METSTLRKGIPVSALFDPKIVLPAIGSAFVKFDPRTLIKKPVMFVLEIVTALTTVILVRDLVTTGEHIGFEFQIILWLWFTVLFANFSEAIAEGRGKAQADALRRQRTETQAKLLSGPGRQNYKLVPSTQFADRLAGGARAHRIRNLLAQSGLGHARHVARRLPNARPHHSSPSSTAWVSRL